MNSKFKLNKRGNAFDVIYIIIVLFLLSFGVLTAVIIYDAWMEGDKTTSDVGNIALQKADDTLTALDGIFAFIIVMLFILVIIGAFMINTHPAFFIVTLILLIIAIIIAVQFSNIYEEVSTGDLKEEAERYTVMSFLMGKLPFIVLVVIIVVAIVLYAKGGT